MKNTKILIKRWSKEVKYQRNWSVINLCRIKWRVRINNIHNAFMDSVRFQIILVLWHTL